MQVKMIHINLDSSKNLRFQIDMQVINALDRLENDSWSFFNEQTPDLKQRIAFLYSKGFIQEDRLERFLEVAIFRQGVRSYDRLMKSGTMPECMVYTAGYGIPEILAYTIKLGVLTHEDAKKLRFLPGTTPESFCQEYASKDLVGEIKKELRGISQEHPYVKYQHEKLLIEILGADDFMRKEIPL
jgi:hypothetical protein